jgi:tRNA A-37 threonylcarbamoyl transferase component Bud32
MRKCSKGTPCSKSCISRNKKCRVVLKPIFGKSLARITRLSSERGTFDPEKYKDWEEGARGAYGVVSFSPDGKRVVKTLVDRGDGKGGFGPYEVELGKMMARLGHSPQIYSSSDKHIEMERIKGSPLWKGYAKSQDESSMSAPQALAASRAIRDLHRAGFFHGDMHALQFVVDGPSVKLLDFGLSGPIRQDPRRAIQDLNKISGLINWSNPELDGDPYVQLVRRYRELYKASPKKKAEKLQYEEEVALRYAEELRNLP